jgi:hypothetical protein
MPKVIEEHGSASRKKVLQLAEFNDNRYLELGEFYFNNKEKEWRKKKGVSLNRDNYKIIKEAIEREHETIMNWLEVDYVPDNISRYNDAQERALLENEYTLGTLIISEYNDPRDLHFFKVENKGGKDIVSLNSCHPFKEAFDKAHPETKEVVAKMMQAFNQTKKLLQSQPAYDPEMLFNHLEIDWSRYLKDSIDKKV